MFTQRAFAQQEGPTPGLESRMDGLLEFHGTSRHNGEHHAVLGYIHTQSGCHWMCEWQQLDNKNLNFYLGSYVTN